jgi:hypothetical protein
MATAALAAHPGQIWRDDCYYLDRKTGEYQRKYLLVLGVDPRSGDTTTAVFTSKPNGLSKQPASQAALAGNRPLQAFNTSPASGLPLHPRTPDLRSGG